MYICSRAVSEAIAHLLYWMYRLWVMLPVTTVVVSLTSARSPGYQYGQSERSLWKVMPSQEDMGRMVMGLNPGVGK